MIRALLCLLILVASCDSTSIRRQSQAADAVARAFNEVARPALVQAYSSNCREAIDAVCPNPPCERVVLEAAFAGCDRRWQYVFTSYEIARAAHDAWREHLTACQDFPDSGACTIDLQRDGRALLDAVGSYRCAVRGMGRADLDPIPGPLACGGSDGGHDG